MRFIRNKRGQIAKFIESPFVLILIFVIMGIFIASTAIISIRKPDIPEIAMRSVNPELISFLFERIESNNKEMFLFERLIEYVVFKESPLKQGAGAGNAQVQGYMTIALSNELAGIFQKKNLLNEDECFVMSYKQKGATALNSYVAPIFLRKSGGKISSVPTDLQTNPWPNYKYIDKSFNIFIKEVGKEMIVYKGECLK